MALTNAGWLVPFNQWNLFENSPSSTNIAASTHWVGGQFYAPVTDTITAIHFSTGTVSSPVFQLEAAITALDANGYPLGADVAASSTTITNPSATTNYSVTISASVTAGTMYGIIVRVKATTYTSGSANVIGMMHGQAWGSTGAMGIPVASNNTGSSAKANRWCTIMPKFSSNGWYPTPGILISSATGVGNLSNVAATGNVVGNRFVLPVRAKVFGYALLGDLDNPCNIETYAGTDNTAVTGSSVTITAAYRNSTNPGMTFVMLATPIILEPATYRCGIRNTSAAANTISRISGLAEAGMAELLGFGCGSYYQTAYASGAWTDTNTAVCGISPIFSHVDDGLGEILGGSSL